MKELNWLAGALPGPEGRACQVKLRSAQKPAAALVFADEEGQAVIALDAPQYGIAPGQAAVLYDGSRVLGGGWITGSERGRAAA